MRIFLTPSAGITPLLPARKPTVTWNTQKLKRNIT